MTSSTTAGKPAYIQHTVSEKDVTVDWFFGERRFADKVPQLGLVLIGWFFALLPEDVTYSAISHRGDSGGTWGYREGFVMFDRTMLYLGILLAAFIVGYFALYLINRAVSRRRSRITTYDVDRLEQRLELAADHYASKYGPREDRRAQRRIRIEPYGDVETYELRDLYRTYGVD